MIEISEARDYLVATTAMIVGAATLALLGGFAATLTFAAHVWDLPDRTLYLAYATIAYLLAAGLTGFLAFRRLRLWRPLHETRQQLRADAACLTQGSVSPASS